MLKPAPEEKAPAGPLTRWWRGFVLAPLRRADEESRAYLASPAGAYFSGCLLDLTGTELP
jgi:hypothetical protein